MRNNFNANVPTRKPRTQIGRVLGELASDPGERIDETVDDEDAEPTPRAIPFPPVLRPAPMDDGRGDADDADHRNDGAAAAAGQFEMLATSHAANDRAVVPDRTSWKHDHSRLAASRQRLATLRERLASAARPTTAATDPRRTAATIRGVVDELRARLEAAAEEQSRIALTLEETAERLECAEAELGRERKTRAAAELRAEERQRIADDAVAEAEALAAERDQLLAELAEQRRLDDDQAALLVDAEAALALRDTERASTDRELDELRDLLDVRALEVADLERRLKVGSVERSRLEARVRDMQADLDRLAEAGDALEDIEALVIRRER